MVSTKADSQMLKQSAEASGGKQFDGNPQTISHIYEQIATFF
jgi:hypothetical protein